LQLFVPPPCLQYLIIWTAAYLLDKCFRSCNKQLGRSFWQACAVKHSHNKHKWWAGNNHPQHSHTHSAFTWINIIRQLYCQGNTLILLMKRHAYLAVCAGRWLVMFHWFSFSNTKYNIAHIAQTTLIYTPSSKRTCHENNHAKNNCTFLSQISSCEVKLKYELLLLLLLYIYIYIYTHTKLYKYIYDKVVYIRTYIL
jgi:hypothetical protein